MTEKIPRITAQKLSAFLLRNGFFVVRQKGSHQILKNEFGIRVTLPVHAGKIIHPKIISTIQKDLKMSLREFLEEL